MKNEDCIRDYMFFADPFSCDGNHVLLSSCENYSDKEIVVFDDHELISREPEDYSSSVREIIMAEQVSAIDGQHDSYLLLEYPVAAFMDLYFSEKLKISDFLSLPLFMGEYGFLDELLSLLFHVQLHLLINDKDEIISVLKLLGWLLWKSAFT
jgi:hypothetical protein